MRTTIPLLTLEILPNGKRFDVWLCAPGRMVPVAVGFLTSDAAERAAVELARQEVTTEHTSLWHRLDQRVGYDRPRRRYEPTDH